MALDGRLPREARWILGSSVTFLEKPGRDAPRPIRVGQWLRNFVGKTALKRHRTEIGKLMAKYCQYGVAMPG
eukprot:7429442-Karenia_brevis.AAC.1